ncbi:MAG: hypothetical protein AAGI53_14695 [Planctomycetota bacterium]
MGAPPVRTSREPGLLSVTGGLTPVVGMLLFVAAFVAVEIEEPPPPEPEPTLWVNGEEVTMSVAASALRGWLVSKDRLILSYEADPPPPASPAVSEVLFLCCGLFAFVGLVLGGVAYL